MPISNTLDYTPLYTGNSQRATVTGSASSNPITVLRLIDKIHDTFIDAGMTETGNHLFATGQSVFPLGFPFVTATGTVTGPASCGRAWLTVGDTQFSAYNPYTETAGSDPGCVMFAWGTSDIESLTNLAAAVQGATQFDAVASGTGPYYITYTAKAYGPTPNFVNITPTAQYGAGGTPDGGGYEFLTSTNTASATQYKIQAYGVEGGYDGGVLNPNDGRLVFTFVFGTNTVDYILDTKVLDTSNPILQYTILANAYGFAMFDPHSDNHGLANSSLLAQAPRITEFTDCTSLVMIVGPGKFRDTTCQWQTATVYLNGQLTTWSDGPYPQPLALRSPGPTNLLTLAGVPIAMGTYLFTGGNSLGTRKVVGKMWDCVMVSDYITSALTINNVKHERVSAQTGTTQNSNDLGGSTYNTRCSMVWRYDN